MDNKRINLLLLQDFIINVVITIVTTVITTKALNLSNNEQLIIALVIFLCVLVIQTNYKLLSLAKDIQGNPSVREFLLQIQTNLNNLNNTGSLVKDLSIELRETIDRIKALSIQYGSDDLWVNLYQDKINTLNSHLQLTLINEAFEFDASTMQQRSELIKNVFRGNSNDYFWAISSYDALESFTTTDINDFLRDMDKMFQEKLVSSIRRLFIYNHKKNLDDPKFLLFIYLHEKSGYECKVLERRDFDSVYKDFGDKGLFKDFGIYGDSHIWETPQENIITQFGIMCRNKTKAIKYKKFYEKLWSNALKINTKRDDLVKLCDNKRIYDFRELVNSIESLASEIR